MPGKGVATTLLVSYGNRIPTDSKSKIECHDQERVGRTRNISIVRTGFATIEREQGLPRHGLLVPDFFKRSGGNPRPVGRLAELLLGARGSAPQPGD